MIKQAKISLGWLSHDMILSWMLFNSITSENVKTKVKKKVCHNLLTLIIPKLLCGTHKKRF